MLFNVLFCLAAATVGSITGLVRTEQGRPVAGASVSVQGGDIYTTTDDDGRYVLSGILLGSQKLRVHAEGHKDVELLVPIDEGMNTVQTITLQAERTVVVGDNGHVVVPEESFHFSFGANCDSLAEGADSTRSWGAGYAHGKTPPIVFGFRQKHGLRRMAIVVLDDDGKVVRRLREARSGIADSVSWDGRDDHGKVTGVGAYVVRFATDRDSLEIPFCRHSSFGRGY